VAGSLGKAGCTADLLCAPKDPSTIQGLPNGEIPTCTATYGDLTLEGRCLPRCFTAGNPSAGSLDEGDCPADLAAQIGVDDVVCAPCFNPIDGESTGACEQFGDMPADPTPPPGFAECGAFMDGPMMGLCVPQDLVMNTGANLEQIPVDTCAAGELCAPANKAIDTNLCFTKCESPLGGAGACVATYIVESTPDGMGLSGTLGQVTCEAGETCTPCLNPLSGMPTGACEN
jgi:hypothetical protein